MPTRQLFVVVEREAARMRMRLVPVRGDHERLPAVNRGLGIVPLEVLGEGDHPPLTEVYHVFRRLELSGAQSGGEERLAHAFSAWNEALARSGIGLRIERRALYGAPLPRTDWRADGRGISVRPWDVELTALAAGLRTIVKLDGVPRELVATLQHAAAQRGLQIEVVAPQRAEPSHAAGLVTLLVARDASALVEARSLEAVLLVPGGAPGARTATLRMGELLGYPSCCVERFARIAEQNDTTLAWALLPGVPHVPAPPVTQWLQPGLALLSHSPCDLHCPASIALGERVLAAVEANEPGFAVRWRSHAARVQVVDQRGNRMALAVDGDMTTEAKVTAADVLASGAADPDAETRARRLAGRTVTADSGGLVAAEGGWYAPYVADHRGPPSAPV
jgi:hypothetical protein